MEYELNNITLSLNASDTAIVPPRYLIIINLIINLVGPPTVIIPAVMVIMVIVKNKQLRSNKTTFIVNLLVADICFAAKTFIMNNGIVFLYLIGLSHLVDCTVVIVGIFLTSLSTNLMFLPLSIDRLLSIVFPFSYENIMTAKVVTAIIGFLWVAVLSMSMVLVNQPINIIPSLGTCRLVKITLVPLLIWIIPILTSMLLITGTSIYLRYKIIKSNRFFHGIHRTAADREKSNRAGRLVEKLQEQVKPTISVFIVGGFDGLFNLLFIFFAVLKAFIPVNADLHLMHLVGFPLLLCQSMVHSLAYGFYNKEIKKEIFTCSRPCTKRSKVIVLNGQ